MSSKIVKKSFYLTSLFADIKSSSDWPVNDIKTAMLLFAKMNQYSIFLPDFPNDKKEFSKLIKKIPTTYTITREDFLKLTGVESSHFAREINKVRKSLASKIINTPHPLENDPNSGISMPWFSLISYSNKERLLTLDLNPKAMERLIAFVKYSKIEFINLIGLKNSYAIHTYLFLKILKDISFNKKLTEQILSINELKERLFLHNKYRDISSFKKYVLEVVKVEINKFTDMCFDYELIKEGRSFTKIKLFFDYKEEFLREVQKHEKLKNSIKNIGAKEYPLQDYLLVELNLNIKKIKELYEKYNENDVVDFIKTFKIYYIKKGGKIKNKSGYFLTSLENYIQELNMKKIIQKSKQVTDERDLFENYCRYLKRTDVVEYIDYILSYSFLNATIINEEVIVFLNENLSKLQKFAYHENSEKRVFDFKLSKLNLIDLLDLVKTAKVKLCSTTDEWNSIINCNIQNATQAGLKFYYESIDEFLKFPNKINSYLIRDKKFVEDLDNMEKTILDKLKSQNQ